MRYSVALGPSVGVDAESALDGAGDGVERGMLGDDGVVEVGVHRDRVVLVVAPKRVRLRHLVDRVLAGSQRKVIRLHEMKEIHVIPGLMIAIFICYCIYVMSFVQGLSTGK